MPLLYFHLRVTYPLFSSVFSGKWISSTGFRKIH